MFKQFLITIFVLTLLVFAPQTALAGELDEFKIDIRFEAGDVMERTVIDGNKTEIRSEIGDEEFRFKTDGEEFKVEGMVTALLDDGSFFVDGIQVMVDPAVVDIEQEGVLAIDAGVEAEGIVLDGANFAEEIDVEDAEDIDEELDEE